MFLHDLLLHARKRNAAPNGARSPKRDSGRSVGSRWTKNGGSIRVGRRPTLVCDYGDLAGVRQCEERSTNSRRQRGRAAMRAVTRRASGRTVAGSFIVAIVRMYSDEIERDEDVDESVRHTR
jgi:hypothetical protein